MYTIVWPWQQINPQKWETTKKQIGEKITSVSDFDSLLTRLRVTKPKMFSQIYSDYINNANHKTNNGQPIDAWFGGKITDADIVNHIVPLLQQLIADAQKTFRDVTLPAMGAGTTHMIGLTKHQCCTIIALMFFDQFKHMYIVQPTAENVKGGNVTSRPSRGTKSREEVRELKDLLAGFSEPTLTKIFISQSYFAFECIMRYFLHIVLIQTQNPSVLHTEQIIIKRFALMTPQQGVELYNKFLAELPLEIQKPLITDVINLQHIEPNWMNLEIPICNVYLNDTLVEKMPTYAHMVNSQVYLGGDDETIAPLGGPITAESCAFLTRPDTLVALLCCGAMNPSDSIIVFGAERIIDYWGFGSAIKYNGRFIDETPYITIATNTPQKQHSHRKAVITTQNATLRQSAAIFLDSSSKTGGESQFIDDFYLNLNKLYSGFINMPADNTTNQDEIIPFDSIATHHWTYGFCGSNMYLKFFQILLAASASGRKITYRPSAPEFESDIIAFLDWIQDNQFTIKDLMDAYKMVLLECENSSISKLSEINLFQMMMDFY